MDILLPEGQQKLIDFSCQICSKSPAADPANTTTSCLLKLKLQENVKKVGAEPQVSNVTLELQQSTLDSLLEGMGRIRDQLSAVANKK